MRFISIAQGSLAEVRTQLRIAGDLGYCDDSNVAPIIAEITEIKRMLNALWRSLYERQTR